jgi:hypothetical protein
MHLAQHALLLATFEVMEHERGEDRIEESIRVWERIGKPILEPNRDPGPFRFAPGPSQCLRIGVEPDDGYPSVKALDPDRQATGAAADIENGIPGLKRGMPDQGDSRSIHSEERGQGVVQGQ